MWVCILSRRLELKNIDKIILCDPGRTMKIGLHVGEQDRYERQVGARHRTLVLNSMIFINVVL
jgi:hypothetical protein